MKRDLRDKVIVVTGGGTGIGAATAVKAATLGMNAVVAGRRETQVIATADRIETFGRKALPVVCDVTRDADVENLFQQAWDTFGRVDVVFANAGYGIFGSVLDTTDQQVREIFETNFHGTLRTIKAGVPRLRDTADGLKQVLICSSSASEVGIPMFGAYCATKAAQDSIAGALRAELHDEGIAVTSVHPVGTKTEFAAAATEMSQCDVHLNTPGWFQHDTERVASSIIRGIRRPRPEVWPSSSSRWLLALATALPRFPASIMRRKMQKMRAE